MKMLSTIVDTYNVHVNNVGTIWFKVKGKTYVRKLDVKPFSNYPIIKVRYKNQFYLVDSILDNVEYEVFTNILLSPVKA